MSVRVDPLEQFERLGRPLVFSVSGHVLLFATAVLWGYFHVPLDLGDPSGGPGGAVPVTVVQGVPLPRSRTDVVNPVANAVKHEVPAIVQPQKAEPQPKVVEEEAPDAVPLEKQRKRRSPPAPNRRTYQAETKANQVPSSTGAKVASPLYTGRQRGGGGGVGFGRGSPFGSRYGWYAEALQRRLAEEWRKTLGQAAGAGPKPVVVSFVISSSGAIEKVRISQSSGNRSLDYSAHRAALNTNPFQPLPRGLGRRSIQVEMWFELR
jgi:TonB family protein